MTTGATIAIDCIHSISWNHDEDPFESWGWQKKNGSGPPWIPDTRQPIKSEATPLLSTDQPDGSVAKQTQIWSALYTDIHKLNNMQFKQQD